MSKKKLKTKRGITLIALVITIIVMLILVVATVTVALNGGLFSTTKQAAKDTQIATVREMVNTDVLAKRITKKGIDITQEELGSILVRYCDDVTSLEDIESEEELENVELKLKKEYGGHDTTLKELYDGQIQLAEWEEHKDEEGNITITKGKKTLKIGDYVEYTTEASPSTKWRVLGAEDGKILLMADSNVLDENGAELKVKLEGTDWGTDGQPLVKQLNEACQPYLNTEYAESIRSIKVEDINKITGFNPLCIGIKNPTDEQISTGTKCCKGQINEYGNKVKYTLTSLGKVSYDDREVGNSHFGIDAHGWPFLVPPDFEALGDDELLVECTSYAYYAEKLSLTRTDVNVGIRYNSPAYRMIFQDSTGRAEKYWTNSTCVETEEGYVVFEMFYVNDKNGEVWDWPICWSRAGSPVSSSVMGARPVVTLRSNVKLTIDDSVAERYGSVTYKLSD